jgi:hypothetical protein
MTMSVSARAPITAQGLLLKNARERMDMLAAYRKVGSTGVPRRSAARRIRRSAGVVERHNAGRRVAGAQEPGLQP